MSLCSAKELFQFFFHVGLWYRLVRLAFAPPVARGERQAAGGGEPGMVQDLPRGEALRRLSPQDATDEASRLGRQRLGDAELAAADLAEERAGLHVVEGIAAHEDGVEHDAQAPHVRRLAGVAAVRVEDFGADVGRTAMLVGERIVGTFEEVRVL